MSWLSLNILRYRCVCLCITTCLHTYVDRGIETHVCHFPQWLLVTIGADNASIFHRITPTLSNLIWWPSKSFKLICECIAFLPSVPLTILSSSCVHISFTYGSLIVLSSKIHYRMIWIHLLPTFYLSKFDLFAHSFPSTISTLCCWNTFFYYCVSAMYLPMFIWHISLCRYLCRFYLFMCQCSCIFLSVHMSFLPFHVPTYVHFSFFLCMFLFMYLSSIFSLSLSFSPSPIPIIL